VERTQATSTNVVSLAQNEADGLAAEILLSQYESSSPTRLEQALSAAFGYLGFRANHVGGAGQADIVLDAAISAGPYRAVVEVKSNRAGKINDAAIDWNSLQDHRKATGADHALVVAPGFSGGNLLKRADDYGVALATATSIAEVVRSHRDAPFTLVDLRALFETPGPTTKVVEQLQQIARSTLGRWRLIAELVTLAEQLPSGVYADAQKLWLLLSFQQKENAPSREAVEDAVGILASRAVGVLRPINGSGEFSLTMQAETALRRIRAMARALSDETAAPACQEIPMPPDAPSKRTQRAIRPTSLPAARPAHGTDFEHARAGLLRRLESLGFAKPELVAKRSVRLARRGKVLGLTFRGSKLYPSGGWWWTFTADADRRPLEGCDQIVLVGLMEDPADPTRARSEVLFVKWEDAMATASASRSWTERGRLHIVLRPSSSRWAQWIVDPSALSAATFEALLNGT
jgi:hypothetical protein